MIEIINFLIAGVLILVVFKTVFNKKSNIKKKASVKKYKKLHNKSEHNNREELSFGNMINNRSVHNNKEELSLDNTIDNNCHIDGTVKNMDKYIKNKLLNETPKCNKLKSANKVDNCEYKNNFFNFHNKINGSSRDHPDPVDKVNLYRFNGVKCGTKIQDLYDGLTSY